MRTLLGGVVCATCLALTGTSAAAPPGGGWDGSNPFNCTVQNVGSGTKFPQPGADPFCVEFDKTHQNVTQLGVVDFLSREPARVAAASNKCFYWQRDHWRGSIVQDNGSTETYGYDGSYYFDKARGAGGAHVSNFRVAGQSGDPTAVPGFPAEYRPYFGKGEGGVQGNGAGVQAEPRCVELARTHKVYRTPAARQNCRLPGGRIGRGIGGISLKARRSSVRSALGAPTSESLRAMRYCLDGGGTLTAGFLARGERRRVAVVKVDNPAFSTKGIAVGASERRVRKIMRRERVRRHRNGTTLLISRGRTRTLVAVTRKGRVRWVAVARPRISLKTLARDLRRVR